MRVLPAFALLALAALPLLPAAQANGHCVVDTRFRDFVCEGQEWCDHESGICATPICVDDMGRFCVLEAPDGSTPTQECVVPSRPVAFVCFGEWWCSEAFCTRPVCLTDEGRVCVLTEP